MRSKSLILFCCGLLLFLSGAYSMYRVGQSTRNDAMVSTEGITSALRDEGFLITQSYLENISVTIDRTSGSMLKDFFFGQTIHALATVKVSLGVDLRSVTSSDILIDEAWILVRAPAVSVYSTEIVGDITIQNDEGVAKKILDHDDGYNAAANEMRLTAMQHAQREEIIRETEISTKERLKMIIGALTPRKEVVVELK